MGTMLPKEEYSMAAIMGLETEKIEEICKQIYDKEDFVVPANNNTSH